MNPLHHGSVLQHVPRPAGLQAAAAQGLVPSKLQVALRLSALASTHGWREVLDWWPAQLSYSATRLAFDILAFYCVMLLQQRTFTPLHKSDTVQGICGTLAVLMGLLMVMLGSILLF